VCPEGRRSAILQGVGRPGLRPPKLTARARFRSPAPRETPGQRLTLVPAPGPSTPLRPACHEPGRHGPGGEADIVRMALLELNASVDRVDDSGVGAACFVLVDDRGTFAVGPSGPPFGPSPPMVVTGAAELRQVPWRIMALNGEASSSSPGANASAVAGSRMTAWCASADSQSAISTSRSGSSSTA